MWERLQADSTLKLKHNVVPTLFNQDDNLFFCLTSSLLLILYY